MANHKSALKRIRSNRAKQLRNKYQHKTTRNAIKKLRELTDKKEAEDKPILTNAIKCIAHENIKQIQENEQIVKLLKNICFADFIDRVTFQKQINFFTLMA